MAARDGSCSASQLNPSAMHTSLLRTLRRPEVSGTLLIALGALLASCGGDGSVTDPSKSDTFVSETPQPAGHRIVSIASAFSSTCALLDSGAVDCWGGNVVGEFGNGTERQPSDVPVPGAGGLHFAKLYGSTLQGTLCGLDADARAFCWGNNPSGAVGNGTTAPALTPSPVAGGYRFTTMTSAYHTCALDESGQAYCWGMALGGALANGNTDPSADALTPTPVVGGAQYTAITNGLEFTCALRASGEADCWGWGAGMGSGPIDRSVSTPTAVDGGLRYSRISAGPEWVCALTLAGSPYCWGKADEWATDFRAAPAPVPTNLTFREIAAISGYGACALTSAGEAYCWWGRGKPLLVPGHHKWAGLGTGAYPAKSSATAGYSGYTDGGAGFYWSWATGSVNGQPVAFPNEPQPLPPIP